MTLGLVCVSQSQLPKLHANPVKVKLQLYSGYPVPASLPGPRAAPVTGDCNIAVMVFQTLELKMWLLIWLRNNQHIPLAPSTEIAGYDLRNRIIFPHRSKQGHRENSG